MPSLRRSLVLIALVARAVPAMAQEPGWVSPAQSSPASPGFLTNYALHMDGNRVSGEDPRFTWVTDLGGDVDLVDYGRGRVNFLANFNGVLGEERRAFELNQTTFTLDFRASFRTPQNELAGVFHHVSRHLSDRPRVLPIDWNMIGVEYWHRVDRGLLQLRATARALVAIEKSSVDYQSELGGRIDARYPARGRVSAIASGAGTLVQVEQEILGRDDQRGGRLEGGVQIRGEAAAVELFLAYERRIDAHPVDLQPMTWTIVGFRLLSR
jgi:hypothetical protein